MKGIGIVVALGFLSASAFMNFHYGFSLGRTVQEGWIYGVVGMFAVASNGLCPFLLAKTNYEMTLASLTDLEEKRARLKTSRYDERIEELRDEVKRQAAAGANLEADAQAVVLASLMPLEPKIVRLGVLVVFGVMVELGAALLLFASVGGETLRPKATVKAPMWRPKGHR